MSSAAPADSASSPSPDPGPSGSDGSVSTPCVLNAIGSSIPSGILGWLFGFVPSVARHRAWKHRGLWLDDGAKSASNLMLFSGMYSLTHCIITRIRQVDDAFNRGAAGCATGLVLGWGGGPAAAAQSCLGIGLISYVLDLGSVADPPAHATSCCSVALGAPMSACSTPMRPMSAASSARSSVRAGSRGVQRVRAMPQALHTSMPPVMWLGAVCGSSYFQPSMLDEFL
jgi:hypothetical protein